VKHRAQLCFDHEDLEAFHEYRERRLLKVPLDQLLIEPIKEPTPSVSLEGDSKEKSKTNSGEESQEKSTRESQQSEQQSQNGKSKCKESEKYTTQSTKKTTEQTSARKQVEIHSTSTKPIKPLVIYFRGRMVEL